MSAPDAITVLATFGALATKRVTPAGIEGYGLAKRFRLREESVADVDALATFLARQACRPREFVIRAAPLPGTDRSCCRRLLHHDPRTGEVATFAEQPRLWVAFDFDHVPPPVALDPVHEPEAAVDHLRALLPEPFHDASCAWQATSSLGLKPGLRFRLWFILSRPLNGMELEAWTEGSGVDPAVFRPVEPIYTASPIFDGVRDPVPRRVGLLRGLTDVVEVPAELPRKVTQRSAFRPGGGRVTGSGLEGRLALMGDGEGLQGFRQPILSAVGFYAARFGAKALAEHAAGIKAQIRAAIERAPKAAGRRDAEGYGEDAYLDVVLEWFVDRQREHDAAQRHGAIIAAALMAGAR